MSKMRNSYLNPVS